MQLRLISYKNLDSFTQRIMQKLNVSKEDAEIVADNLVLSNLRGIDSHGVARLQRYVDGIKTGYIIPDAKPEIIKDSLVLANVNGNNGLGQPMGNFGMELAIKKAKESGIGFVTVNNSNHFGFTAYYPMKALEHNLIGFAMTNSVPLVVPTFGKNASIGTNPIAVAVPTDKKRPWVMDFATSVIARGKLEVYNRMAQKIPSGWATNEHGHTTEDTTLVLKNLVDHLGGGILTLGGEGEKRGGHKGYGLAVMVDIFCGVLSGANYGPDLVSKKNGKTNFPSIGHMFMVIDPEYFIDLKSFKERMDDYINILTNSQKADGESRIYVHGEKEYEASDHRMEFGLPLHEKTVEMLLALSEEFNEKIEFIKA